MGVAVLEDAARVASTGWPWAAVGAAFPVQAAAVSPIDGGMLWA
jgi:hypothetical protein